MDLNEGEASGDGDRSAAARFGRRLSLAGFAPFAALALWLYGIAPDHPWRQATIALLIGYAAVMLSFLGGIRWGLAMPASRPGRLRDLVLSLAPPLAGWASLTVAPPLVFGLLAVAFAAQGAWDSLTLPPGSAPDWFRRARLQMTMLAVAALIVAFVATS